MTEAQWFSCQEPRPMLGALKSYVSERKLRLFVCACCRRHLELLPDARFREAIETAERFADEAASANELTEAERRVGELADAARQHAETHPGLAVTNSNLLAESQYAAALSVCSATSPTLFDLDCFYSVRAVMLQAALTGAQAGASKEIIDSIIARVWSDEQVAQTDLLRDLFNEWFRPVVPDPTWFTADVMALANAIYDGHTFEHMPILADALQDAGCASDEVLNHCRDTNQIHARGCWVLDLILGKV